MTKITLKYIIIDLLNQLKLRKSNDIKADHAGLRGNLAGLKWIISKQKETGYNPFN